MLLNLETVKALVLAEIEKEGEDYIYKADEREKGQPLCMNYEEDGTPSCLVGRALDSGGVFTFEQLNIRRGPEGEGNLLAMGIDTVVKELNIAIDNDAYDFLWTLQDMQDDGYTWGQAFEKAVNYPMHIRR